MLLSSLLPSSLHFFLNNRFSFWAFLSYHSTVFSLLFSVTSSNSISALNMDKLAFSFSAFRSFTGLFSSLHRLVIFSTSFFISPVGSILLQSYSQNIFTGHYYIRSGSIPQSYYHSSQNGFFCTPEYLIFQGLIHYFHFQLSHFIFTVISSRLGFSSISIFPSLHTINRPLHTIFRITFGFSHHISRFSFQVVFSLLHCICHIWSLIRIYRHYFHIIFFICQYSSFSLFRHFRLHY